MLTLPGVRHRRFLRLSYRIAGEDKRTKCHRQRNRGASEQGCALPGGRDLACDSESGSPRKPEWPRRVQPQPVPAARPGPHSLHQLHRPGRWRASANATGRANRRRRPTHTMARLPRTPTPRLEPNDPPAMHSAAPSTGRQQWRPGTASYLPRPSPRPVGQAGRRLSERCPIDVS